MDYFGGWRVSAFQMEANVGITNAILEMLVNVRGDEVHLLPACPKRWRKGALTCVSLPAGRSLDLRWDIDEDYIEVRLTGGFVGGELLLYPPTDFYEVRNEQGACEVNGDLSCCRVLLKCDDERTIIFTPKKE